MIEEVGEHWGTFLESFLVAWVHHEDEPVHLEFIVNGSEWVMLLNAVAQKVFELWRWVCSKMTHLVIVLWPNASEAFAAAKIIDCHMIAFVPGDDIIQIKNSAFFRIDSITCYSNHMFIYVFTFQYKNSEFFLVNKNWELFFLTCVPPWRSQQ